MPVIGWCRGHHCVLPFEHLQMREFDKMYDGVNGILKDAQIDRLADWEALVQFEGIKEPVTVYGDCLLANPALIKSPLFDMNQS